MGKREIKKNLCSDWVTGVETQVVTEVRSDGLSSHLLLSLSLEEIWRWGQHSTQISSFSVQTERLELLRLSIEECKSVGVMQRNP